MRQVTLTRIETGDAGNFGTVVTDSGFTCYSGELPWRDNSPNVSCVPTGIYLCEWVPSEKFGFCYKLQGVPGRSDIEIHAANFMGDVSKGFLCNLRGCIALGETIGMLALQTALLYSREALNAFCGDLKQQPFQLTIVGA